MTINGRQMTVRSLSEGLTDGAMPKARQSRVGVVVSRICGAVVVLVLLAVTLSVSISPARAGAQTAARQPSFLIGDTAFQNLVQAGLPRALQLQYFNTPATLLNTTDGVADPAIPNASLVETFDSCTALEDALYAHSVPATVHTVLLDLEAWSYTPPDEQAEPFACAARAAQVAHAYGRHMIFAPAANLVNTIADNPDPSTDSKWQQYIDLNFAGKGAAVSDYLDIQAQQTEGTSWAPTFAPQTSAQARNANAKNQVIIGLSTNPAGRTVTASDLMQLFNETPGASHYWLNVPGTSQCAACGSPQPAVAVQFLEELAQA